MVVQNGLQKSVSNNREITDKDGNNWWYTKHEAEIAARWFCNNLEYRIRNGYED